jgi:hypothetical protein
MLVLNRKSLVRTCQTPFGGRTNHGMRGRPAPRLHHALLPTISDHNVLVPHGIRSLPAVRVCDSGGELRRKGCGVLHRIRGGIHDLEPEGEAPPRRASGVLFSSHGRNEPGEDEAGSAVRIQEAWGRIVCENGATFRNAGDRGGGFQESHPSDRLRHREGHSEGDACGALPGRAGEGRGPRFAAKAEIQADLRSLFRTTWGSTFSRSGWTVRAEPLVSVDLLVQGRSAEVGESITRVK